MSFNRVFTHVHPCYHTVFHTCFLLPRRILESSAAMVTKKLKAFLQTYCPAVDVRCKSLTGKGLHTFVGMLGYVQKVRSLGTDRGNTPLLGCWDNRQRWGDNGLILVSTNCLPCPSAMPCCRALLPYPAVHACYSRFGVRHFACSKLTILLLRRTQACSISGCTPIS